MAKTKRYLIQWNNRAGENLAITALTKVQYKKVCIALACLQEANDVDDFSIASLDDAEELTPAQLAEALKILQT